MTLREDVEARNLENVGLGMPLVADPSSPFALAVIGERPADMPQFSSPTAFVLT